MDIEKEFKELSQDQAIDWKKIKEILCGIASSLELVCEMIPAGTVKSIICGLSGIVKLICNQLPDIG